MQNGSRCLSSNTHSTYNPMIWIIAMTFIKNDQLQQKSICGLKTRNAFIIFDFTQKYQASQHNKPRLYMISKCHQIVLSQLHNFNSYVKMFRSMLVVIQVHRHNIESHLNLQTELCFHNFFTYGVRNDSGGRLLDFA